MKRHLVYAGLYLAAIPLFAFIYSHYFQGSFYAPYARLEQAAVSDTKAALDLIDAAWHRQVKSLEVPEYGLKLAFELRNPTISQDGTLLQFHIDVPALYQPTSNPSLPKVGSAFIFSFDVYIQDDSKFELRKEVAAKLNLPSVITDDLDRYNSLVLRAIHQSTPERMDDRAKKVFEALIPPIMTLQGDRGIWLRPEEDSTLNSLFKGFRGDPTTISQGFLRMTYFSTTVITTIGFGDIVPITPAARTVVAVEGILGIILAGLFLNAAFQQSRP